MSTAVVSPDCRDENCQKCHGQGIDLVQDDEVRGLLHEVHAVVEARSQRVDVVPVERRDERLVEPTHDRVGGVVRLVLGVGDALADLLAGGTVGPEHLPEEVRAGDEVDRLGGEEVEERGVARGEAQAHGGLRSWGSTGGDQARSRLLGCLTHADARMDTW